MACAREFLPWARCRTTAASAGTQSVAALAASPARATTILAGSTGPAAETVRRKKGGGRPSCASPRFGGRGARASLCPHHAGVQEPLPFGRGPVGCVGAEHQ